MSRTRVAWSLSDATRTGRIIFLMLETLIFDPNQTKFRIWFEIVYFWFWGIYMKRIHVFRLVACKERMQTHVLNAFTCILGIYITCEKQNIIYRSQIWTILYNRHLLKVLSQNLGSNLSSKANFPFLITIGIKIIRFIPLAWDSQSMFVAHVHVCKHCALSSFSKK